MFPVFYGNIDLMEQHCQFNFMQGAALEITFYPYFTVFILHSEGGLQKIKHK